MKFNYKTIRQTLTCRLTPPHNILYNILLHFNSANPLPWPPVLTSPSLHPKEPPSEGAPHEEDAELQPRDGLSGREHCRLVDRSEHIRVWYAPSLLDI